jgi:hypothetical protein
MRQHIYADMSVRGTLTIGLELAMTFTYSYEVPGIPSFAPSNGLTSITFSVGPVDFNAGLSLTVRACVRAHAGARADAHCGARVQISPSVTMELVAVGKVTTGFVIATTAHAGVAYPGNGATGGATMNVSFVSPTASLTGGVCARLRSDSVRK